MCNCIEDSKEKLIDYFNGIESFRKPIELVEYLNLGYFVQGNDLIERMCGPVEITLKGQKKKPKRNVVYTYCPFCGEKYNVVNNNLT